MLEAANDREALQLVHREPSRRFDMVVSDLVMPQLNGKEMMDELRRHRPGLPALFISGYTHDVLAQRSMLGAADLFLEKPFSPNRLLLKVRETLHALRPEQQPAAAPCA